MLKVGTRTAAAGTSSMNRIIVRIAARSVSLRGRIGATSG